MNQMEADKKARPLTMQQEPTQFTEALTEETQDNLFDQMLSDEEETYLAALKSYNRM